MLLVEFFLLQVYPLLQFPDGDALGRKLDVGVGRMHFRARGMAHERHANFLQDARLHQASVEGVAEIVETDVAETGVLQRGLPRAFHDADWAVAETDDETRVLPVFEQMLVQPVG